VAATSFPLRQGNASMEATSLPVLTRQRSVDDEPE